MLELTEEQKKQQILRNKLIVIRDQLLSLNEDAVLWADDETLDSVYSSYSFLDEQIKRIPYYGYSFDKNGNLIIKKPLQ
jgi:hypothetical protein